MQRIRDYSTSQLNRVNENYIFQRQRLRKFSAQNYLKIRETRKYTQKTLTKVMDNLPALYLDLSTCRQGLGERQDSLAAFEEDPNIIQCLELGSFPEELSRDSSSLYFTPSSTPLKPGAFPSEDFKFPTGNISTPKRYRFKSKSFSNFLPLWKNNGGTPPPSGGGTVETEVVVEKENHEEDYITILPPRKDSKDETDKESLDFLSAKSVNIEPSP
ncbi:Uncharacterized protein FKW44_009617 [Caligus rogercresseyi]|uniref:Uncharacterized protein n=1 Tax=Caligus rogercresseyi TaxID=217165 RepID=A0A7T8K7L7_CALRO|nr:Uncharacterized protein FKW44_009617 [Caligus rogercresseyi]